MALAVRLSLPAEHQVFYDEYEHADIAANLARTGALAETLVGGLPGLDALSPSPWPAAHHVLLAVAGAEHAFAVSLVLGSLTAALLGPAGFLWAALPLPALFSRAADLTSTAAFLFAAALAAVLWHDKRREPRTEALAVALLALAAHARFENVLLAVVAACWLRLRPAALGLLAAAVAPAAVVALRNRAEALPGFTGPGDLLSQLPANLLWFVSSFDRAALVAVAVLGAWKTDPRRRVLCGVLVAAYLLFYSSFFRGRFDASSECRYAVLVMVPLAALAASAPPAAVGAAALAAVVSRPGPLPHGHRADAAFLREAAPLMPKDAYTVAFNASAVRAAGKPAAAVAALDEPGVAERAGAVLRDYWWDKRPEQAAALQNRWKLEPLLERDGRALYRVKR